MNRFAVISAAAATTTAFALLTGGCGGRSVPANPVAAGTTAAVPTQATAVGTAASGPASTAAPLGSPGVTPDPGTLPQNHVLPTPDDPLFKAGVQDLWQAIVTDDATAGLPCFFPESAYLQVKSLKDASVDYQNRLIAFYRADIHAAHELLGADARNARFVSISVPMPKAQWILPGVEWNKESYYRVYGSRITYTIGGKTKSFGVFSLISWRGRWYVVHLGPNPRPKPIGTVDQPEG